MAETTGTQTGLLAAEPGFEPPPGASSAMLESERGMLRYAVWEQPEPAARGTIVLSHGLSEQIEKYYDVIGRLLERGFAVAMMDWRGHGRSDVTPAGLKESFRVHDDDYALYFEKVVRARLPAPYIGIGHSMGGCLLCSAAHDHPEWFKAAILNAPMLGIKSPSGSAAMVLFGRLIGMMPDFVKMQFDLFKKPERFTSDLQRFERLQAFLGQHPELLPRFKFVEWYNSANDRLALMRRPGWYGQMSVPVLTCLAGDENLTDNNAAIAASSEMPDCRLEVIDHAWHEILMEKETIQLHLWEKYDSFLDQHAPRPQSGVPSQAGSSAPETPEAPDGPDAPDTPEAPGASGIPAPPAGAGPVPDKLELNLPGTDGARKG